MVRLRFDLSYSANGWQGDSRTERRGVAVTVPDTGGYIAAKKDIRHFHRDQLPSRTPRDSTVRKWALQQLGEEGPPRQRCHRDTSLPRVADTSGISLEMDFYRNDRRGAGKKG